jgi:hypothetical protein
MLKLDGAAPPLHSHPPIFSGVSLYVNGMTVPPYHELKVLVGQHGGYVDHYNSGLPSEERSVVEVGPSEHSRVLRRPLGDLQAEVSCG